MINMNDVEEIGKPLFVLLVAIFGVYIILPSATQDNIDAWLYDWRKCRRLKKTGRDVQQIVEAARNRKV